MFSFDYVQLCVFIVKAISLWQNEFPEGLVSVPIVHGGLGPVSQNDVVHAMIESNRKLPEHEMIRNSKDELRLRRPMKCRIVVLGSGVRIEAAKEAIKSKVEIKR